MTRFVQGDGVQLAVREWGDPAAPTVLCVHGYPDDSSVWTDVAIRLAERFHVVTYDVRGAGASDKPKARKDYLLDRLTADLAAVLDAVSPDRPVHLLAHDWGSIQAWHAVTDPELKSRFRSYTSISGPCLDHAGHWIRERVRRPSPRRLRELVQQLVFSGYIGFFQLPLLPELAWRTGLLPKVMGRLVKLGDGVPLPPPATVDGVHGLQLYRANMAPRFAKPVQRHTDVPVQVLAPTRDPFVSTSVQTDIARWVSDLRVRRIAGGHWLPRSRPEVIARCVTEFAEHLDGAPETRALRRTRPLRPKQRWADHLVLVTGAGSGIGRETALAFAEHGADVVVSDVDGESAARTAELAELFGISASAHTVDVADEKAMIAFAEEVRRGRGVPDVVINNAGIGMAGALLDTSTQDWQRVIDVNLWGVIHGSRIFADQLVERGEGGHLVNIASAAAYLHSRTLPAYATTKSAVLTLTQCLRAELAPHRIGVTAVCPGIVNTNITRSTRFVGLDDRGQEQARASTSALYRRRNYPPSKVARAILLAVHQDKPIAPVTPEAHAGLLLSRLTPGLLRAAARYDLTPH
ncbi:SDR family oxidoreductase [Crossiella cryophila]|uniref:NAD(P)-dependent dehydrogenase (Short-subunit alcohol dehydrogenase family)/pimeloyl-ACP methyl ester carboxylesterase n=1 Tax=Crossiella cryophila TaxID=43355 RepID=A0A7W7CG14_9PSEU|nr:SDR family oxidoreductase [Crossiella cryophila]MBB4680504.1 NAD(P)-dependent dehydrogenase (short-subunit alcohol dehydrogenase family)/pimeloyl-ACP methyl ester carboxylesterase [Crossiella cryophila]